MAFLTRKDRELLRQRASAGDLLAKVHEDLRADIDALYKAIKNLQDGFTGPQGPQGPAGAASGAVQGDYNCAATVDVLDVVYLISPNTIEEADNDGASTYLVVGAVVEKPTSTTAKVQYSGEIVGYSGLTPGETYYLSDTPGEITITPPSTTGQRLQKVGFAKNATTLVLMIDRDFIIL